MEGALLHSAADHKSLSLGKSKVIRNRNKSVQTHPFVPPRTYSSPSSLYLESLPKLDTANKGVFLNPNCSPYYPIRKFQSLPNQQPPLVPLPILGSSRKFHSLPNQGGNSLSPTHKKRNKGNKTKPSKQDLAEFSFCNNKNFFLVQDKFSGSVYSMAPPPSSLPMPKFPVRIICKADVTGVDSGATDNLCRLLNLR